MDKSMKQITKKQLLANVMKAKPYPQSPEKINQMFEAGEFPFKEHSAEWVKVEQWLGDWRFANSISAGDKIWQKGQNNGRE